MSLKELPDGGMPSEQTGATPRVDSEWWWISEDPEADERLREWLTVIRDATESMKTGFLFQQPIWDFEKLAAEHAGGEESLYELPSARYIVTLKYTEDLMSVVILDEPLTAEGGNRSEESGGT